MAIRALLRDHPHRSIALVTETHALVLRHSPTTAGSIADGSLSSDSPQTYQNGSAVPRCMVEFTESEEVDLRDYRGLSSQSVQGTLGLITVDNDIFLCLVTGSTRVATVRPGETVRRIHAVEFHCLNRPDFDLLLSDEINPYPTDSLSQDGFEHASGHGRHQPAFEHPCLALKKLLSGGTFYYSTDFDLTNRLQDRSPDNALFEIDNLDEAFLWNSYMIGPLVKFRSRLASQERDALDSSQILTSVIRGFVLTITLTASNAPIRDTSSGLPSTLTLISRLSCRRAGTRFNARGIDDDGNVANFVETETVFWSPSGLCFSYAQVRGSVPLFWEQATGLLPGQQKIQITRSAEATQPAFDKHVKDLEMNYGAVHVLNLLSDSKPGEIDLTRRYRYHILKSPLNSGTEKGASTDHQLLRQTEFDFHAETKGPGGYEAASMIRHLIDRSVDGFAYYMSEEVEDHLSTAQSSEDQIRRRSVVVLQQEGVFRTNCLDCLDRTNLIQTIISQLAVEAFLGHRGERAGPDFWMRHSSLWADNGDHLSKIYAGTGALKSSFTRHGKMSLAGAIADARKSATRMYINNFADKGRQNTMDVLLGRLMGQNPVHLYDPINDYVMAELNRRSAGFTSSKTIRLWVGTFNLNGRMTGFDQDLSPWLCPKLDASQLHPEIVAVGFQEIVELSPQQIMSTDPAIRQRWERAVKKTLNDHAREHGETEYVLLRSGQLVGAALSIFVKAHVIQDIKNVEGSVKKTGMSGMAGNKGAVAIRMDYENTRICFVTAHLAAGFANYEERNRDYSTISNGLRFQRNRSIADHDTIIWLGDFNYRIGLSDEKVRKLIRMGDLDTLYTNDQLNLQMVAGLTFPFYSEARIMFMPTYKYNLGSDTYDTSEKSRIPAWCDRVLRKGENLRQVNYNTAPLLFSDHRPVYATFYCTVSIVDDLVKEQMSREIYERRRNEIGGSTAIARPNDTDDEDLIGYDSIAPGFPPASSDRRKWWLDNAMPVRSNVKPPGPNSVLNPQRPSNPFAPTDEPDWIERKATQPRVLRRSGSSEDTNTKATSGVDVGGTSRRLPQPLESPRSINAIQPPPPKPKSASTAPQSVPPPLASSSSQSTTRATDRTSRKPPPPTVPKKPVVLRSSSCSSSPSMPNSPHPSSATVASPPLPPPPRRTGLPASPPPQSRPSTSTPSTSTTNRGRNLPNPSNPTNVSPAPTLPPRTDGGSFSTRNPRGTERQPSTVPRQLMDEDDDDRGQDGLRGWEALKPQ
ncbi:MAG: inositol polyphosphate 5-phosphatase [Sclerophora amabilis]|nr:MAG: inositol polyphosphate 5-phosphatase [Sclerophora amabilis]